MYFNSTVSEDLSQLRIISTGLTCDNCERKITKSLKKLPGVYMVDIDHETGKGVVKFNETKLTEVDILLAVTELGYPTQKRKPSKLKVLNYKH